MRRYLMMVQALQQPQEALVPGMAVSDNGIILSMKPTENINTENMIFQPRPLVPSSFFQRLFRQKPIENVILELNNLLSGQDILTISQEQFHASEASYKIDLIKVFAMNLQEFHAVYWNEYLNHIDGNAALKLALLTWRIFLSYPKAQLPFCIRR